MADQKKDKRLEHSEGGVTTRDDVTDLGVPMLPGRPDEPVGPEDALGPGAKRGDYRERVLTDAHVVEPNPDAKPGEPQVRVVNQTERAANIADEPGKGGVTTA